MAGTARGIRTNPDSSALSLQSTYASREKPIGEERRCRLEAIGVVDILQVLEGLAYVGFIAGAIFAVIELRTMSRDRKTELLVNMAEHWSSREFVEALSHYAEADFQSAEKAEKTCPRISLFMMSEYFDSMATLARKKAVSFDLMYQLLDFEGVWERMKPWCLHMRDKTNPSEFVDFEWMANECRKKRLAAEKKA
jgi:hypothetical protein